MNNEIEKVTNEIMAVEENNHLKTRALAEVQAQLFIARQFPRDEKKCYEKMLRRCDEKNIAEKSIFQYPRAGQQVLGGTIKLAEILVHCWGNIQYGVEDVHYDDDHTKLKAYAWDLETNVRVEKIFCVEHKIGTKRGLKSVTDPRDKYELTANMGSRRVRECIFKIIGRNIVDDAIAACKKRLIQADMPRADILKWIVKSFKDLNISVDMIEKKYNQSLSDLSDENLIDLKLIYTTLKEKNGKREDFFEIENINLEKMNDFMSKVTKKSKDADFARALNDILACKTKEDFDKIPVDKMLTTFKDHQVKEIELAVEKTIERLNCASTTK